MTRAVAESLPSVRVVDEPRKGLVVARETGRLASAGDVLVYVDADCRAPLTWLARVERRLLADPALVALSGPYRFYDWDRWGRLLIRAYDYTLAPATQFLVKYDLRIGTIFYGGNFAVRRPALERIGGFDTRSSSTVKTPTSVAGCSRSGRVSLFHDGYLYTSARRYVVMGRARCSASTCATSRPSSCAAAAGTRHIDVRT